MPSSEELLILPWMISPLKGRKTIIRNSTFAHCQTTDLNVGEIDSSTVYIDDPCAVTDQALRSFQDVVEADAEADLLNNLGNSFRFLRTFEVPIPGSLSPCWHIFC